MADDDNIIRLLKSDGAPALGDAVAKRIAARAVEEFNHAPRPQERGFFGPLPVFRIAAVGVAFASVVLAYLFAWQGPPPANTLDRQRVMLAQFSEVFGDKLQAVIRVNGKTQIVLGETSLGKAQPVAIHLSDKGQDIDILSFSGEKVQVSLNGKPLDFETLADGKGGVILAGDHLFWNGGAAQTDASDTLSIAAKVLEM